MIKNSLHRLFGNENAQLRAPVDEDGWPLANAVNTAAALQGRPASPLSPSFPYPIKYSVAFGTAQTSELWIPANGYALSFWDSTNLTDLVNVRFGRSSGDDTGASLPFRPGHALGLGDFTWLGLTWSQIVGATGTLVILPRGVLLDENR